MELEQSTGFNKDAMELEQSTGEENAYKQVLVLKRTY